MYAHLSTPLLPARIAVNLTLRRVLVLCVPQGMRSARRSWRGRAKRCNSDIAVSQTERTHDTGVARTSRLGMLTPV